MELAKHVNKIFKALTQQRAFPRQTHQEQIDKSRDFLPDLPPNGMPNSALLVELSVTQAPLLPKTFSFLHKTRAIPERIMALKYSKKARRNNFEEKENMSYTQQKPK